MAVPVSESRVLSSEIGLSHRKTMSVVVPVYFNEGSLVYLFEQLLWLEAELDKVSLDLELIFVDDGSKDGSWNALVGFKQTRPATRLIRLARNFGAVAASNTGFQFVTGDCFMVLSADLQEPTEQLLEMAKEWRSGGKFVISVRKERAGTHAPKAAVAKARKAAKEARGVKKAPPGKSAKKASR